MKISGNSFCPCGSQKKFKNCCRMFHYGEKAKTALELMKSRYSAYVANDPKYIIETTHRDNSDYTTDINSWETSISDFAHYSDFKELQILDFTQDNEDLAYVTFKAVIFQGAIDSSFTEKSKFVKVHDQWFYHSGEFIN